MRRVWEFFVQAVLGLLIGLALIVAHAEPSMNGPVTHLIMLVDMHDVRSARPIAVAWHTEEKDCFDEVEARNQNPPEGKKYVCTHLLLQPI